MMCVLVKDCEDLFFRYAWQGDVAVLICKNLFITLLGGSRTSGLCLCRVSGLPLYRDLFSRPFQMLGAGRVVPCMGCVGLGEQVVSQRGGAGFAEPNGNGIECGVVVTAMGCNVDHKQQARFSILPGHQVFRDCHAQHRGRVIAIMLNEMG